jgi:hypothetical protein
MSNDKNCKVKFNFFKFAIRLGFVAVVLEIIVGILVGFGYGV